MIDSLTGGEDIDFTTEQTGVPEAIGNLGVSIIDELPFINSNPIAVNLMDAAGIETGGGRIPISSAIPNFSKLAGGVQGIFFDKENKIDNNYAWQQIGNEAVKPLLYYMLPFGGGQIKKTSDAIYTLISGGNYTYNNEGDRQMKYDFSNPTPYEVGQAIIFGPSATKGARDWVDSGFKSQSVKYTAAHDKARSMGMDMDVFNGWWNEVKGLTADKDAMGNSISGSKKNKIADSVRALDIPDSQKLELLKMTDEDLYKELTPAKAQGVSDADLLEWWGTKDRIPYDVDDKGKNISGSKRKNTLLAALDMGLDAKQTLALLTATEYKFAEEMAPAKRAGVNDDTLLYWWVVMEQVEADRDVNGKPVSSGMGSRRQKLEQILFGMQLTARQREVLLEAAGY